MEKVLSQEEISALFSAMSAEDWEQEYAPEEDRSHSVPEGSTPGKVPFGHNAELIAQLIMPLYVPVSGELRGSKLTVHDLLRMSVGDVVSLKDRLADPMVLCVGGIPKFTGRILRRRGKKVFSILGRTSI
jgi:flagellar motor switch protein FliM